MATFCLEMNKCVLYEFGMFITGVHTQKGWMGGHCHMKDLFPIRIHGTCSSAYKDQIVVGFQQSDIPCYLKNMGSSNIWNYSVARRWRSGYFKLLIASKVNEPCFVWFELVWMHHPHIWFNYCHICHRSCIQQWCPLLSFYLTVLKMPVQ